jgi:uncharacterized protein YndB with AHSA1/START domain
MRTRRRSHARCLAFLALALTALASSAKAGEPRSLVQPVSDRVVHVAAELALPPDAAWDLFTTQRGLESWLAPAAEVELRVGGRYALYWQPQDRENDSTIGCAITALAPGEMIAFQWRSPVMFKRFANGADPLTHVVVSFAPHGAGTRVHLVHSGWRSTPAWEEARAWQERAWRSAFSELQKRAQGEAPR